MSTKPIEEMTKDELLGRLASERKDEIVDVLHEQERSGMEEMTKETLVKEYGAKATKDELLTMLGDSAPDDPEVKKDQLLNRLESVKKDELIDALDKHLRTKLESLTKDELVSRYGSNLSKDELIDVLQDDEDGDDGEDREERKRTGTPLGAISERDPSEFARADQPGSWGPPPAPAPPPVRYVGAAPGQPGQRVRVDLSGLPAHGVFAGRGASAAGTIIDVDPGARQITVRLDASFNFEKEITLPPERVFADT
jgi:hypothetical protein